MKTYEINGQKCIVNADGAYVPLDNLSEIDIMRNTLVEDLCSRAVELSELLTGFRNTALKEVNAFADLSAEQHDVRLRGKKGGFSLLATMASKRSLLITTPSLQLMRR